MVLSSLLLRFYREVLRKRSFKTAGNFRQNGTQLELVEYHARFL
jgi:hypothetical protein